MSVATVLADAGEMLREMARGYTEDINEAHLLTHGAVVWLLHQDDACESAVPQAELKQALRESRRAMTIDWSSRLRKKSLA